MNGLFPIVTEAALLLFLTLFSFAIARPLRKKIAPPAGGRVDSNADLATAAAGPLFVILLSWLAFAGVAAHATLSRLLPSDWPVHRKAWLVFWAVVLAVRVFEYVAGAYYRRQGRPVPIPDLFRSLLRTAAYVAASFFILNKVVGMNIAPLLTSTALLTAVVGFALQGVLGNLLAGMSLHLVRSVGSSDWISVGDVEGQVVETNWRETRLRTVSGHMMIVPNSKLAEAVLHNMSQPTPLRRHRLEVGASYADPPEAVIAALVEAARSVPEVLSDPPPSAFVTEYKDFGINYRLRFWSNRYHDRTPLEGDVARMIWYKFKRRGIEIPFPMSDKLLNDFMEVVNCQKKMPPQDRDLERRLNDLVKSEFVSRVLLDGEGHPLVSREELRGMASGLRHVLYTRGETVFRQGDGGESCFVLVRGKVHGEIQQAGVRDAARFELGPGVVLGEMSLMTGLPRSATITCTEEVELLEIPAEAFAQLLSLRKEIPELLSQMVAKRASANALHLDKLKEKEALDINQAIQPETILQRFLHILQWRR